MRTTKELREIALGLAKEEIFCDWCLEEAVCSNCDVFHGVPLISEVDHIEFTTKNIGLLFEKITNAFAETEDGDPIFATFETLTREEALEVAEMVLRYMTFLNTPVEIEIPHS